MANATPPARPAPGRGRSLDYFLPLSPAEEKLLDGYRRGTMAEIGAGRPTEATPENRVSAAFVRFLALGGDEAAQGHEHGVELRGAWVEGTLAFESAELAHRLVLKDCRLEAILAVQARLKFLALDGSSLAKGMLALSCRCESDIRLADGFHSEDGIYLSKAQIGSLDCNGGRFEAARGPALTCEDATIAGSVYLGYGFRAEGEVRLRRARIGGDFASYGGRFVNPGDYAIDLERAAISGEVVLKDARCRGRVGLQRVRVGGNLECKGRFANRGGMALAMAEAQIEGNAYLDLGFTAVGEVILDGAAIGGTLNCSHGKFLGAHRYALNCNRARIKGSVFLDYDFCASGTVYLAGASIGGDLSIADCRLRGAGGEALVCSRTQVTGMFSFRSVRAIDGAVDLRGMRAALLSDDMASWGAARGHYALDGFTYDRLSGAAPADADKRIEWLDGQNSFDLETEFKPQPWEQAVAVLRAMGRGRQARKLAIATHRRKRRAGEYFADSRILDGLYGALLGYGYSASRLLYLVLAVWGGCGLAYLAAANAAALGASTPLLAPVERHAPAACLAARARARSFAECPEGPDDYATFNPFVYSADVLLPVLDFGYADAWQPVLRDEAGRLQPLGLALRWIYWLEIAIGWVVGLQLVGLFGNLIRRD